MDNEKCVYDPWLLVFILSVILTFKLLHLFAIPTLAKCFRFLYRSSKEDNEKLKQLKEFTQQKSKLNMTDNFAKYSKLERQIKKLESELQVNSTHKTTKSFAIRVSLSIFLKIAQVISCLLIVLYVRRCYLNTYLHGVISLFPDWMQYEMLAQPPLWIVLPFWIAACHYIVSMITDFCMSE